MTSLSRNPLRCDLFCAVVDNYGDAGVCWRIARQLVNEAGWEVRLIIDRPELVSLLAGLDFNEAGGSSTPGVRIIDWGDAGSFSDVADIVIEAFGCRLPDTYVASMATRRIAPVWVNLDYLSAEDWIESCHGLPSPDPKNGLVKYFFYPGFVAGTGGITFEPAMKALAAEFSQPERRLEFLRSIAGPVSDKHLPVSLFCYPDSAVCELIAGSAEISFSGKQLLWLLAEPVARSKLDLQPQLLADVRILRFLPQTDYDRLLLSCEINFVRGEDSFVRAQLAARPFVWQAYRQQADAHLHKVEAFLNRYLTDGDPAVRAATTPVWAQWNRESAVDPSAWSAFVRCRSKVEAHNVRWREHLWSLGNLATNLAEFCESKL